MGSFRLLALVNSAAAHSVGYCEHGCTNISSMLYFQFFWVDTQSGIAGLYDKSCFPFWGCPHCFSQQPLHLHSHQLCTRALVSLLFHQHLFFHRSHPCGCEAVSLFGFDLHVPYITGVKHQIYLLVDLLYTFFKEMSIRVLCSFLNQVVFHHPCWVVGILQILWTLNPLWDTWFANTFSYFMVCLFRSVHVSSDGPLSGFFYLFFRRAFVRKIKKLSPKPEWVINLLPHKQMQSTVYVSKNEDF